jgi:hypothetical protein
VLWYALDQLFYAVHVGPKVTRILVSAGIGALVGSVVAAMTLASKQFELLMPAGRPKYQRWRRWLLGAVGAVLAAVIGAAIWAAASGS